MKTRSWIVAGILLGNIILSSCTNIYIHEISKSPDFTFIPDYSKTAIIFSSEDIILDDFIKTFNDKYQQNRDFVAEYINLFTEKSRDEKIFSQLTPDLSNKWSLIKTIPGSEEELKIVDAQFNSCSADYIIHITSYEISDRFQTRTNVGPSNMPTTTTSTEYCVFKARFQVSDRKTRKIIVAFESKGESIVFLFTFKAAFEKAMKNSIEHAVEYLKTGEKEF